MKTIWRNHVLRDANPTPSAPKGRPSDHKIDEEIVKCLDETPTASVRQIADTINVPKSTVYRHLTQDLGYKFRNVRWIPHFLDEAQKQQRVIQSKALLNLLHQHDRDKWRFIFTGDESWFYYDNQTQKIWMPENDPRPEVERPNIMTKKIMVCLFWNPHGLLAIHAMERGEAIDSACFIEQILQPILQSEDFAKAKNQKQKFILHMDNSRVHRSKAVQSFLKNSGLHAAPHPPYSPDLAPSDFYLFGILKQKLLGLEFVSVDELIQWIIAEFYAIPHDELVKVFEAWEKRLAQCLECKGDYIE